jgi:hypothetical protein
MKKPVTISIDESLLRTLDSSAKSKGLSRSRFVDTILEKELGIDAIPVFDRETKELVGTKAPDSPPPPEMVPDKAAVIEDLQARIDKLARTRYRTLPTTTARRMAAKDLK